MNDANADAQDEGDMASLAAGNEAALSRLMQRHGEKLFHYLIRVLQNETEAAELAQETFVRVFQNCSRFRPGARFTTWLYTIATNLARDYFRRQNRFIRLPAGRDGDSETDLLGHLPDARPLPSDEAEMAERAQTIRQAVMALPEDLRIPLLLAEYEEKSHAEIAAILDCTSKAVEMKIYRARQQLRATLATMLAER